MESGDEAPGSGARWEGTAPWAAIEEGGEEIWMDACDHSRAESGGADRHGGAFFHFFLRVERGGTSRFVCAALTAHRCKQKEHHRKR